MNKEIRVLQLIDSLNVGGAEVLAVNIANGLVEKNIISHLCVTRKEGALKKNIVSEVGYLFLDRKKRIDISAIIQLKKYIKKNDIQIIHAHSSSSFIAFCVKLLYLKVKIVWHDHYGNSDFLNKRNVYPLIYFSSFFSQIIVVNKKLERWSVEKLKCEKVLFLNNFASFSSSEKQTILKGVSNKKIVHLAGFREQKDHLNLLKAFKTVWVSYPEWTLHLIGKDYQNDYSLSIKEYIKEEQLENNVFLYGMCSDVKNILSQATIGVLSSKSEGLPISLLEYGLAKIPVLITNVGECKNVVKNKNGLVPPNRSDIFAKALKKIIESKELRTEIAFDLYEEVVQNYSRDAILKKLINVYRKVCSKEL